MKIKQTLINLVRTKTIKHSGITFAGTFLNGILGVIYYILMARFLGPYGFGVFSVAITAMTLVTDVTSLGVDTSIVRFVGKYIHKDNAKALKFLKLAFEIKVLVWILVLAAGWMITPWVAGVVLHKFELAYPLRLAMVGVGGGFLFSFLTNSYQAMQKYWHWSGINVLTNAIRLAITALLFWFGVLESNSGLITYFAVLFLGFFIGVAFLPRFWKAGGEKSVFKEFLGYNKWVAVFIAIAAVSGRLDMFMATRLLTLEEVGIYSVAVSLASIVPQIVYALGAVVAPKLASLETNVKAINYLKKLQFMVVGLAVMGLVVGIPMASYLIPYFYGQEYLASISPFVILLIAQAVFLVSVPAHTAVFYYFSKPSLFVWISLGHLVIIAGTGFYLISHFGFMGAAVTVLIGTLFNFIVPFVWVLRKFKLFQQFNNETMKQ